MMWFFLFVSCGGDGVGTYVATLPDAGANVQPQLIAVPDVDACKKPEELYRLAPLCANPLVTKLLTAEFVFTGNAEFSFNLTVPIDHRDPSRGTFGLHVELIHHRYDAPTFLVSAGYGLDTAGRDYAHMLGRRYPINVVIVEHRFYGPSTPMRPESGGEPPPEAYAYLTIEQAAADSHRVVELLKPIYQKPWVSIGASKGGMTALYHRRFYPDDVSGTIAELAFHSDSTDDPRYAAFLETVGQPACRAKIVDFQRALLARRAELLPLLSETAREEQLTFRRAGSLEIAFEHAVQEYRFSFWQYGWSCAQIPAPTDGPEDLLAGLVRVVPEHWFSDATAASVDKYGSYYYQLATQLGGYGPLESGLTDLLHYPGTFRSERYAPPIPGLRFDPSAMRDVQRWLLEHGDQIILLYGEYDPFTAGAFEIPQGRDVHKFVIPGAAHDNLFGGNSQPREVIDIVTRWAGPYRRDAQGAAPRIPVETEALPATTPAP